MNKEEILAKSRQESKDEMEIAVKDQSMKWTYITMVLAAAFFAWTRAQKGDTIMDLCVTVCVSCAVGQLYRYFRTKDKRYLIAGVIAAGCTIMGIIRYVMGY